MRLADLMQRSTVRLAAMVMLTMIAALLLAGGVGFGLMHAQLSKQQDARVTEVFNSLSPFMAEGDATELVEIITTRIAASPERSSIFVLQDHAGTVLLTSVEGINQQDGWSTLPAGLAGLHPDYAYRTFRGTQGAFTLTVGLSNADVDNLADIMGGALSLSALIVVVLTVVFGSIFAMRMQQRMTRIDEALSRVSQGDLAMRLAISDRRDDIDRISSTINATLARLETSVSAMRQVSADIAHDLRTPLNRMKIRLEQAADLASVGEPVSEELAAAIEEADRINATFAALLRISQIEAGARVAGFEPTNLTDVLTDVAEVYDDVADDVGLTLHPFAADTAMIQGDADLLTQMFANLIENAIRHCPIGSEIRLALALGHMGPVVTVADTGPGIPPLEREKVFQRLYRLDQSRATSGSGLGLSLVKAIADLHGATLVLTDTRDDVPVGLTVSIQFPSLGSFA